MNISAIIGICVTETAQIKKSIYLNWRDSPYSRFGFVLFYCYAHSFFMKKKIEVGVLFVNSHTHKT